MCGVLCSTTYQRFGKAKPASLFLDTLKIVYQCLISLVALLYTGINGCGYYSMISEAEMEILVARLPLSRSEDLTFLVLEQ